MESIGPPWVEGEKIPTDQLEHIFRRPPGVPDGFYRSSLVVGSRGAGKTTLFRYHQRTHSGHALYLDLTATFSSLTTQTGRGALATDIPTEVEQSIVGKASSLLAVHIAIALTKAGYPFHSKLLRDCVPSDIRTQHDLLTSELITRIRNDIIQSPLELFHSLAAINHLPIFVGELGELLQREAMPLLLLLDRADMVSPPSLVPAFQLLDQSIQHVTLLAMRPCHAGDALTILAGNAIPGDHFGVTHLGTDPRSDAWAHFVEDAIRAQLGEITDRVPAGIRDAILAFSRDSLKTAIELYSRYLSAQPAHALRDLLSALEDLRDNQMAGARRVLQQYHPNYQAFVTMIRREIVSSNGSIRGPVMLAIEPKQGNLFGAPSPLHRFIDLALRCGALCLPTGERWVPGLRPITLEVPTLLLWDKSDGLIERTAQPLTPLSLPERDVMSEPRSNKKQPSLFVAYRMADQVSKKFRSDIEAALSAHPSLSEFKVVDGRVPAGSLWAPTIRKRIKAARIVIGDVTNMRPDVVFEMGFAFGLGKIVIPAVASDADRFALPEWLMATQLATYSDAAGMSRLLGSINTHLSDPEFARSARPPQPIPARAVWVRNLDWSSHARQQAEVAASREGLQLELVAPEYPNESVMRQLASASLLIVSLDGTRWDDFLHYVCGAVVARPMASQIGTFSRRIVIIEEPSSGRGSLAADSLRRCEDIVQFLPLNEVVAHVRGFAHVYKKWSTSGVKNFEDKR